MAIYEGIIYDENCDNYKVCHNGRKYTVDTYERAEALYEHICEND